MSTELIYMIILSLGTQEILHGTSDECRIKMAELDMDPEVFYSYLYYEDVDKFKNDIVLFGTSRPQYAIVDLSTLAQLAGRTDYTRPIT